MYRYVDATLSYEQLKRSLYHMSLVLFFQTRNYSSHGKEVDEERGQDAYYREVRKISGPGIHDETESGMSLRRRERKKQETVRRSDLPQ